MRIIHLVPNMNYGGLQEVVRGLALRQQKLGHTVTVACWHWSTNHPEIENEFEQAGIRLIYLRRGSRGERVSGKKYLFLKTKQLLGEGNADILHVHNPFFYYLYGSLAARAAGHTKIVVTMHHHIMFDHPVRRKAYKWRAVFWSSAMLSHLVIACCPELEEFLRRRFWLPEKRVTNVENGIDLGRFLAVPPRPPRPSVTFGTVARMAPEKNHRLLLQSFAQIAQRHPDVRLRLLGGGELEPELRALTRHLQLEDKVEFCGFSNDVPAFLSTIDVFVLPSDAEAMPLTLFEAIASGLPVVATAVSCVPRIVDFLHAGWIAQAGDVTSMAAALEQAIACPDRRALGENARRLVSDYYSVERMAADYQKLYDSLTSGMPVPAARSHSARA